MSRHPAAKWIKRVSPAVLKADLAAFVRHHVERSLKANTVVNSLYTPSASDTVMPLSKPGRHFNRQSIWQMKDSTPRAADQPLPVPPPEYLYYKDAHAYLTPGMTIHCICVGYSIS